MYMYVVCRSHCQHCLLMLCCSWWDTWRKLHINMSTQKSGYLLLYHSHIWIKIVLNSKIIVKGNHKQKCRLHKEWYRILIRFFSGLCTSEKSWWGHAIKANHAWLVGSRISIRMKNYSWEPINCLSPMPTSFWRFLIQNDILPDGPNIGLSILP